MGDSQLDSAKAAGFLNDITAEDLYCDEKTLGDPNLSVEERLKLVLKHREETRRRLQISFLSCVSSGSKEDMESEAKTHLLKLLLHHEANQQLNESQKTLLEESKSKQDQLVADLASLQTKLNQLKAKRFQHSAKRNQALARYFAMSLVAHHVLSEQRRLEFDIATLRWYRDSTIARAIDTMTGCINPDPDSELGGIFRIKSAIELENEDGDDAEPIESPVMTMSEAQLTELKNKQREYGRRIEELCALEDGEELFVASPNSRVPDSTIETTNFPQLDDVDEYGSFPMTPATDLLAWNLQHMNATQVPKKPKSPQPATAAPTSPTPAPTSPPGPQPSKRKGFFGLFQ